MKEKTRSSSALYALLIGIDCYLPHKLPGGRYYPNLRGCVRDIMQIEDFLMHKLGMHPEQILKLTASNSPDTVEPSEPSGLWPTYENMVEKFQQVTEMAHRGDQVYIHYSGHGGRAPTAYPNLKGISGLDEALVPMNIGNDEARYLRDVEMAYLVRMMVDKDLIVIVVLDCCHSGGATRGFGGAFTRGIGEVDTTFRPTSSLVASHQILAESWQTISASATRNVKTGSGWVMEPQGYTLLAACRASESAYEYPFDGSQYSGALTYWLLDSLKQIGPGLSYKHLHDRILSKIHSQFEKQTPQLQGEANRAVFGSDHVQPQFATLVMQVDDFKGQILLNAGQAHAIREGAQFAIYPADAQNSPAIDQRLALVEITELGATDSWAKILKRLKVDALEQGAQAILLDPGSNRLRRIVRVVQRNDLPAAINQEDILNHVQKALNKQDSGFISLAKSGDPADFQVVISELGEFEIWDAAGIPLPNLNPSISCLNSSSAERIVDRLVHLAKYRNVQELDNHDPLSPLAGKLILELVGRQTDFDPADLPQPEPFNDAGHTPTVKEGEWVFLRIRNSLVPGRVNDPSKILNITVMDLQPDWGITQIYPAGGGLFEPLDPGQEVLLPLQGGLPDRCSDVTDIIKVFATRSTTNFRWLELPALDQPASRSTRDLLSRGPVDMLEALLASVMVIDPKTRNIDVAAYPSHGWATAQVEVRVIRKDDIGSY